MCPQSADVHSCIVTLVALVWLFSTVGSLMCPQIACMRGCIITQIAFECLSSIVHFQMSLQMVCPRECFITQVAFVWLFPTVCFHMYPQIAFARGRIIALVAFVQPFDIFSLCLGDFHNFHLIADVTIFNHNHSPTYNCTSPNGQSLILRQIWVSWKYEISIEKGKWKSGLCL